MNAAPQIVSITCMARTASRPQQAGNCTKRAGCSNRPLFREEQRQIVETAIQEVANFREWTIHALAVRSNHVHVVLAANDAANKVVADFKARATRRLRESGAAATDGRVWADGASKPPPLDG